MASDQEQLDNVCHTYPAAALREVCSPEVEHTRAEAFIEVQWAEV